MIHDAGGFFWTLEPHTFCCPRDECTSIRKSGSNEPKITTLFPGLANGPIAKPSKSFCLFGNGNVTKLLGALYGQFVTLARVIETARHGLAGDCHPAGEYEVKAAGQLLSASAGNYAMEKPAPCGIASVVV